MNCPKCQSSTYTKAGFNGGKQRYKCKLCSFFYTVARKSTKKSDETKQMAINMYLEGLGFRAIGRLLGISHQTAYRWIRQKGQKLDTPHHLDEQVDIVELDEIHSYTTHKKTTAGLG